MKTGGGLLMRGQLRPEVCPGDHLPEVVGAHSACLAGGAWLDAPDFLLAGGMRRTEEWYGCVGKATPLPIMACRS